MKPHRSTLVGAVIIALGLSVAATGWARLRTARRAAVGSLELASAVERDVARLERLRLSRPTAGAGRRPQADALALVNAAIEHAGISAARLRSLGADTSAGPAAARVSDAHAGYARETLRLTLGGVSLPELGRFLQSWRSTQAVWTVEQIGIQREPGADSDRSAVWRASLVLGASYWREAGAWGEQP